MTSPRIIDSDVLVFIGSNSFQYFLFSFLPFEEPVNAAYHVLCFLKKHIRFISTTYIILHL